MTLTANSPASPMMANTSTSRSPSAVTICCDWMRCSAASWSRICAARSNSSRPGRLLHARLQLGVDLLAAPLEHLDRGLHVLRVGLARDEPHARRRAAADLVLQARPAAVGEEGVAAVADAEQLLQLIERVAHRPGVGEGTEVAPGGAAGAAVEGQPREVVVVAQLDVGKALVVRSTTLKRGLCALMRLYSSSSASVSELVTVTSMAVICCTSACTFGSTLLAAK